MANRLREAEEKLTELRKQVNDLTQAATEAADLLDGKNKLIDEQKETIADLSADKTDSGELREQLGTSNALLVTLTAERDELREENAKLTTEAAAITGQLTNLQGQITMFREAEASSSDPAKRLQAECDDLKTELAQCTLRLNAADNTAITFNADIDVLNREKEELRAEKNRSLLEQSILQKNLDNLTAKLQNDTENLRLERKKCKALEEKLASTNVTPSTTRVASSTDSSGTPAEVTSATGYKQAFSTLIVPAVVDKTADVQSETRGTSWATTSAMNAFNKEQPKWDKNKYKLNQWVTIMQANAKASKVNHADLMETMTMKLDDLHMQWIRGTKRDWAREGKTMNYAQFIVLLRQRLGTDSSPGSLQCIEAIRATPQEPFERVEDYFTRIENIRSDAEEDKSFDTDTAIIESHKQMCQLAPCGLINKTLRGAAKTLITEWENTAEMKGTKWRIADLLAHVKYIRMAHAIQDPPNSGRSTECAAFDNRRQQNNNRGRGVSSQQPQYVHQSRGGRFGTPPITTFGQPVQNRGIGRGRGRNNGQRGRGYNAGGHQFNRQPFNNGRFVNGQQGGQSAPTNFQGQTSGYGNGRGGQSFNSRGRGGQINRQAHQAISDRIDQCIQKTSANYGKPPYNGRVGAIKASAPNADESVENTNTKMPSQDEWLCTTLGIKRKEVTATPSKRGAKPGKPRAFPVSKSSAHMSLPVEDGGQPVYLILPDSDLTGEFATLHQGEQTTMYEPSALTSFVRHVLDHQRSSKADRRHFYNCSTDVCDRSYAGIPCLHGRVIMHHYNTCVRGPSSTSKCVMCKSVPANSDKKYDPHPAYSNSVSFNSLKVVSRRHYMQARRVRLRAEKQAKAEIDRPAVEEADKTVIAMVDKTVIAPVNTTVDKTAIKPVNAPTDAKDYEPVDKSRRKRTAASHIRSTIPAKIALFLMILAATLTTAQGQQSKLFNVCGKGKGGHAMVFEQMTCVKPSGAKPKEVQGELYLARQNGVRLAATLCTERHHTVCTSMGVPIFSSYGMTRNVVSYVSPSKVACTEADATNMYNGTQLVHLSDHVRSTNKTLDISYHIFVETCKTTVDLFIETGVVVTFDGRTAMSDLGEMGSCEWTESSSCDLPNGRLVITDPHRHVCQWATNGRERVQVHGNVVSFPEAHLSFVVDPAHLKHANAGPHCISKPTIRLTKDAYVHLEINETAEASWKSAFNVSSNHAESSADNAALQFVANMIFEQMQTDIDQLRFDSCNNRKMSLAIILQLLPHDPTGAMRIATQTDDIVAGIAGEAIMTSPCHQVTVDHEYVDYKVDGTCYSYMPVRLNDNIMFVRPMSRDLVETSPIVDCDHRLPAYTCTNGKWFTPNGAAQVTTIPTHMLLANKWQPFLMAPPAAFHADLAGSTAFAQLRGEQTYRIEELERDMAKISPRTKADTNVGRSIAQGVDDTELFVESAVVGAVSSASTAASKAFTAVKNELAKPFAIIETIVIWAAISLILSIIIVAVVKYKTIQWVRRFWTRQRQHSTGKAVGIATAQRMTAVADALSTSVQQAVTRLQNAQPPEPEAIEMNELSVGMAELSAGEEPTAGQSSGHLMLMPASFKYPSTTPTTEQAAFTENGTAHDLPMVSVNLFNEKQASFVYDTGSTFDLVRQEVITPLIEQCPEEFKRVAGTLTYQLGPMSITVPKMEMTVQHATKTKNMCFGIMPEGFLPIRAWGIMGASFGKTMGLDVVVLQDSQFVFGLSRQITRLAPDRSHRRLSGNMVRDGLAQLNEEMAHNSTIVPETSTVTTATQESASIGDPMETTVQGHLLMMLASESTKDSPMLSTTILPQKTEDGDDQWSLTSIGRKQRARRSVTRNDSKSIIPAETPINVEANDALEKSTAETILDDLDTQADLRQVTIDDELAERIKLLAEVAAVLGNSAYQYPLSVSATRMIVAGLIGSVEVTRCLLDTGASLSLCQSSVFNKMRKNSSQFTITNDEVTASTLTGGRLDVKFFIRTQITLGDGKYSYPVIIGIVPDSTMSHELIIGMNVLKTIGTAIVNFHHALSSPSHSTTTVPLPSSN